MKSNTNEISDKTVSIPKEILKIGNIELYGETIPYNGTGGDIITFMEFSKLYDLDRIKKLEEERAQSFLKEIASSGMDLKLDPIKTIYIKYVSRLENIKMNYDRLGILVGDVMGHGPEDASIARDLAKWFELAADFDIERYGQITKRAIEKINNMFYKELDPTNDAKYVTMIYGELYRDGKFRFVSAGHPKPIVYSKEFKKIIPLPDNIINPGMPLGLRPSYSINRMDTVLGYEPEYHVNNIKLESPGDIFILYTDGLSEQKNKEGIDYHPPVGPSRLEEVLRKTAHLSVQEISSEIKKDLIAYSKGENIGDDISYVIIKKNR